MTDDTALLRRYLESRSEPAFAELVRRHVDLVYSAALRRLNGDAHAAADVAQSVFVTLARDAARLAQHPTLTGWLYTTTRNAALDVVRSAQRRQVRERIAHDLMPTTDQVPDWDRLRPVLDAALDELGDTDRTAVLMRYFQNRPFAEIGAMLRVSHDAARMRVDRALAKLHTLLARRGLTSTATALGAVIAQQATVAAPLGLATSITASALFTTAAAGAATGFFFMTKTTLTLSALTLAGFGLSAYEVQQNRLAEIVLVQRTAERDNLNADLVNARRQIAQAFDRELTLRTDLAQADGVIASFTAAQRSPSSTAPVTPTATIGAPFNATTKTGTVVFNGSASEGTLTLGNSDAESIARYRANQLKSFLKNYAPLFDQLGLTDTQRDQFAQMMLDSSDRLSALFKSNTLAAKAINPQIGRTALAAIFNQSRAQAQVELESQVSMTYGPSAATAYHQFEEARPPALLTVSSGTVQAKNVTLGAAAPQPKN